MNALNWANRAKHIHTRQQSSVLPQSAVVLQLGSCILDPFPSHGHFSRHPASRAHGWLSLLENAKRLALAV
jgi:hypothetical protein